MHQATMSVIIPAKNEECNIQRVLEQFKGYNLLEIFVSDGNSSDDTRLVAERLGAQVVEQDTDTQTIAQGRNAAARLSKADILVFFDADTALPDPTEFMDNIRQEFTDPELVALVPKLLVFPQDETFSDRVFHFFHNLLIKVSFKLGHPFSGGQCQAVRADAFWLAGGYPEHMAHAEDSAMLQKIIDYGKIRFLDNWTVLHSPRRFRVWGYGKTIRVSLESLISKLFFRRETLKEWERVGK